MTFDEMMATCESVEKTFKALKEAETKQAADQLVWDRFYLGMAEYVSRKSKDPSTKTGAVIVDPNNAVVSVGYNGFARGVRDLPLRLKTRKIKLSMVVHCEINAIIFARRDLTGCTLYTHPFMSCSNCAAAVIQAGIRRCVAPPMPPHAVKRWGRSMALSRSQFREAGVTLDIIPLDTND